MKQRFLSLLVLLLTAVVGAGSAWAEDVTLLTFTTGNTAPTAKTDVKAGDGTIQAGNAFTPDGTLVSGSYGWKLDGDPTAEKATSKYVQAKLASGQKLQVGDIISITGFATSSASTSSPQGFTLYNGIGGAETLASIAHLTDVSTGKNTLFTTQYVIVAGSALIDQNTIIVCRYWESGDKGKSSYFTGITITRPDTGNTGEGGNGEGTETGDGEEDDNDESDSESITWLFQTDKLKDGAAFAPKGLNSFVSTDGKYTLTYKGNSDSDALLSAEQTIEGKAYTQYVNLNGATGSSRYMSFTGIGGKGKLTIVFAGGKDNNTAVSLNKDSYNGTAVTTFNTELVKLNNSAFTTSKLTLDASTTYYINGIRSVYAVIWTPIADAPRTFKDFEIDLTKDPVDELPEGVTFVGYPQNGSSYNGAQHGHTWYAVKFDVDGPVRISLEGCNYQNGNTGYVTDKDGNKLGDIANDKCGEMASWTYNSEEPATLTLYCGQYCPRIKVEACDLIQDVTVTYYDTDGRKVIGQEKVEGGSALALAYGEADVTVAEGKAFRGWFVSTAATAEKVADGTILSEDLDLYARVTDIEQPVAGTIYDYDLTKTYFYQEDHEVISIEGSFHDTQHGWLLASDKDLSIEVGGNAIVTLTLCSYSADADIIITDADGQQLGTVAAKAATDGQTASFSYEGPATTLHFTVGGTTYIHGVKVFNIDQLPQRDSNGFTIVNAGDAAGLLLALSTAKSGDIIFLPNGTYDLGKTVQTQVPSGVSLIGQSMEGVVIKNAPEFERIGETATLLLSGTDIYLQDLTLECYAPYDATANAERGAALWDKGTRNILKNVYLRGTQDTYYSNGSEGMLSYFEGGRIEGTTDFICGSGSIFFNGVELFAANSKTYKGTGKTNGDVLVAPASYTSERGYVFVDCVVNGEASQNTTYNMARAWKNDAAATFVGTQFGISPKAAWGSNMSSFAGTRRFALYTSSPTTWDNADPSALSQSSATMANVLGSWDPTTQTAQAIAKLDNIDAEGIYLIEDVNGKLLAIVAGSELNLDDYQGKLLRKANARGGFGAGVAIGELDEPEEPETPIDLSGEKWSNLCQGKSKLVDAAWYGSKQAQQIADVVLSVQKTSGGWMKNDELHKLTDSEYNTLLAATGEHSCLDNYATTQEVRFLAKVYQATGAEKYRTAILKALNMILDAQLTEQGGWGQYWPLTADKWSYQNYITFNDDLTVNVLKLMRDMYEAKGDFTDLVDDATKARCKEVFDNGIELIIACQIDDNGTPAAWCAQHDPVDLLPTEGRPHELPSVSAYESAAIIDFLMTIDRPSAELQACVTSAVAWLDAHKIQGKALENYTNANGEADIRVIDQEGSAIWGRFIQLGGESGATVYNKFFDKLQARGKSRSCKDGHTYTEEEMARVSYDPEKAYEPIFSIYTDANPELFYRFLYNYEDTPAVPDEKGCQIATSLNAYRRTHYQYLGSWSQAVINAYPTWKEKMDMLNELGDAQMNELSVSTYDKSETIDGATVYHFANGFSVSNLASKSYAKGNNNTIKYSIDVPYTIVLPEGMQVTKVKFSGYNNYAEVDAYLANVNGQSFEATDYVFTQKDASGNYFMASHTIDLSESPAIGTLPFMVKGKQCCLIISLFTTDADVNGDGDVNVGDVITYQLLLQQGNATDLNGDGQKDVNDIQVIQRQILE